MKIPVFWHSESPPTMSSKPLLLRELNEYLVCKICCGYLIDATTITECLHSFCKSCIVKHLEESNFCPACDVQVHKAKPLMHIRPDRTLQDLVYKLVPELFRSEMARRKEFYSKHPEAGAVPEGSISSRMLFFAPKDQVSLSLEYIEPSIGESDEVKEEKPSTESDVTEGGKKVLGKRYLCCPAAVTIGHLQKFIRLKYDLEYRYKVDILCHSELLLPEYRLLDVAYITSWTQEEPLRLFYRIYQIKHHYDYGVAESPKTTVSKDSANCQKNDQAILTGGECAKIGTDAPPLEQTLPSNVTNLEEPRGVKRQMPVMPKAKVRSGVVAKKRRLDEISQSARLKLIAKAKSEKLNGHSDVPHDSDESSEKLVSKVQSKPAVAPRSDNGGFKPIATAVPKLVQKNGASVVIAKPTPKPASDVTKPKPDTVKIPKADSTKKDFKGDSDLRPLRPETLPLPPITRIDPKSPNKSPSKTTPKPNQAKELKSDVRSASSSVDVELKAKSSKSESKENRRDKTPDSTNETIKPVTDRSKHTESKALVSTKNEQPKPISEVGKVLSGNPSPAEKPIPELREIDKRAFLEQVDLIEKKESEAKPETVSETLLSEIRDRALSKKSLSKDLSVFVKERTQSSSPPESISDIKEFISATSPEKKQESGAEVKGESGEDPPSKRKKSTNGGPIRTMPNLIAISEIPTPLIARSMQTMAGNKKPEVKIIEAVKSTDAGKMSPKEGNGSPQTSTIVLDLSGKSSRSTSRSSSVGTPDDRKSPSPPAKRASPPTVSITERVITPKPSPSIPPAKSSPQPQNSPLPPLSGSTMFPFPNMNMQAQANLQRTAMSQNQLLQSMALAQRQRQLAMYAASAAKQAMNTTSPLTNRAEFERLRNMLTWNALAQFQNQQPAAPIAQDSPRPSTSRTPDKTPSSMMMKLPNVTRPKAPITKPGHDPINVRIKHFIQSQQSARATSGQGPRANLNSSVREIPNPSLLQQRRLTQLLHAGASQDRVTITKAEAPSPKEIVETKLAANKEITVSIVNPEDKKKSPERKLD